MTFRSEHEFMMSWTIHVSQACHLAHCQFPSGSQLRHQQPIDMFTQKAKFIGPTWGPTEPRWAPCWPHELHYLGRDPDQVPTTDVAGDCWLCYTEPCMVKRATQDTIIIRPCSWKITWDYTGKFYDNRVNDELLDVFVSLKSDLLHLFRLMQYKD